MSTNPTENMRQHFEADGSPARLDGGTAGAHCAVSAGSVWLPIESAPKDGTHIDLFCAGEFDSRWTDCYWGKPHHCCGEAGEYCDSDWHYAEDNWVDSGFNDFMPDTPTHWMPIPASPNVRAQPRRDADTQNHE